MQNLSLFLLAIVIFSKAFCATRATPSAASDIPVLRIPLSVALETFDPTEAEDFVTVRVLTNLGRGLMILDNKLSAQPALAESWTYSKDKKTVTFKMKEAFWSDGRPILAGDFVYGLEHTFSPKTTAKLSVMLQELIFNAKEYKTKKISDFSLVGVRAGGPRTVEFRLNHPSPYFLSLLASPCAFPQRGDYAIKENSPTSGPYVISQLRPASKIVLSPNSKFERPPQNQVELRIISDSSTVVSLYEKNELDVLEKIPSQEFGRLKKSPEMVSAPFLATYYLGFRLDQKPFDDRTLRQAVAASINREDLNKILLDPQIPSSSWVPTPLPTSSLKFGPEYSPGKAQKLLAQSKTKIAALELVFDSQEKNVLITSLIQQQLKKNLGVELSLRGMEWKTYLKFLSNEHPSFFRFAWLAAIPDPVSHLGVFTSHNPNNYTGYANPDYDKMVERIATTPSGGLRTKLIERAQRKLLTDDVVIVPLYHYRQYFLISRRWQGLDLTPMGLLHFHEARLRPSF